MQNSCLVSIFFLHSKYGGNQCDLTSSMQHDTGAELLEQNNGDPLDMCHENVQNVTGAF